MKMILELCKEASDILDVERPKDLFVNDENNKLWFKIATETLTDLNNQELKINIKSNNFQLKDDKRIDISEMVTDFKSYVKSSHFFVLDDKMRLLDMAKRIFSGNNLYVCDNLKFKIQDNIIEILNKSQNAFYIKFSYKSKIILWDYDTIQDKISLTKNTDIPIYSEELVRKGLIYFYQALMNKKNSFNAFIQYTNELEFNKKL